MSDTNPAVRVEIYGKSLTQQGRTASEDAFGIVREASPETIVVPATWAGWVKKLDSALLGGGESTFLAGAVVGTALVGVSAGDSRAYLLGCEGGVKILTTASQKARLGSGSAQPVPFSAVLAPRDVVLLMTDGAWTPLSPFLIEKAVRAVILQHFSDIPPAVLAASSWTGRWDDMTVVALRVMRVV